MVKKEFGKEFVLGFVKKSLNFPLPQVLIKRSNSYALVVLNGFISCSTWFNRSDWERNVCLNTSIPEWFFSQINQIWLIFSKLILWVALARHKKWVTIYLI